MGSMGLSIVFGIIAAVICAMVAASKGRNAVGWFFIGLFFGIFGIIAVCIASDVKAREEKEAQLTQENRRLQEQVYQERMKSEQFQHQTTQRLDTHDQLLHVNTNPNSGLETHSQPVLTNTAQPDSPPPIPNTHIDSAFKTGWYYQQGADAVGPLDFETMTSYLNQGTVSLTTNVWHEKIEVWKPAEEVDCLRGGVS